MPQDWTRQSEAEQSLLEAVGGGQAGRAALHGLYTCAEMQEAYEDLQQELADCWASGEKAPWHLCQVLAARLQGLRVQMYAAGCPLHK